MSIAQKYCNTKTVKRIESFIGKMLLNQLWLALCGCEVWDIILFI